VELFSLNARNIFNLPATHITEGAPAELTLYSRSNPTVLHKVDFKSKSANSAFTDRELTGQVKGIINKGKIYTN